MSSLHKGNIRTWPVVIGGGEIGSSNTRFICAIECTLSVALFLQSEVAFPLLTEANKPVFVADGASS